jgi:general secretion pathway protein H
MPISISRISEPGTGRGFSPGTRQHALGGDLRVGRHLRAGFTLLELLVVIVMVAVLMGTVVLGFTGADTEQRLRGSADQLAYTIELARQYALQRNREWGLYVEPDAIQFVEFDPEQKIWVERTERPFGSAEYLPQVELRVEADEFEQLSGDDDQDLPEVILFSSGEVTPFTVYLEPQWDTRAWEVTSDGISRVRARQAEW